MVLTATQYFGTAAPATAVRPIPVMEPVRVRTRPDPALHENRTVLEHAVEPVRAAGASPMLAFHVAMDALDLLGLKDSAGTRFDSLSKSERDRVMIARTMMTDSHLSADEIPEARAVLERLVSMET